MKTFEIKHNPHPKMRYEITLMVHDAPGPFESVSGYAHYEVTNKECSPENALNGTWDQRPITTIPISFTPTEEGTYIGAVHLDQLQDEDYFGLGMCHWGLNSAGATLRIKAKEFVLGLSLEEILSRKSIPTYFVKADYESASGGGFAVSSTSRESFKPDSRTDIFSMSLRAKEDFQ